MCLASTELHLLDKKNTANDLLVCVLQKLSSDVIFEGNFWKNKLK